MASSKSNLSPAFKCGSFPFLASARNHLVVTPSRLAIGPNGSNVAFVSMHPDYMETKVICRAYKGVYNRNVFTVSSNNLFGVYYPNRMA